MKKSSLINLAVLALSAIGAILGNLAHEKEMEEMKEDIKNDILRNSEEGEGA